MLAPRSIALRTLATWLVSAALPRTVAAQDEADLSWYEGEERRETAPTERPHDPGDADAGGSRPERHGGASDGDGWGIGLNAAYVLPAGKFGGDAELSRYVKGALRPALDLHYFIRDAFGVGAYTGVGFGFQSDAFKEQICDGSLPGVDVSCRLYLIDAGLYGEYRILPRDTWDPWLTVNVGYEHYRNVIAGSASGGGATVSADGAIKAHGVAFGTSVGVDYQTSAFALGPFFSAQFGSYQSIEVDTGNTSFSDDVDKAMHYYLQFGVRFRYDAR